MQFLSRHAAQPSKHNAEDSENYAASFTEQMLLIATAILKTATLLDDS